MNEKRIYILTGPVHTGKTTELIKWSAKRNDVFGILTPVITGKRFFMDAHSKIQFEMEADKSDTEVFLVGRFQFSKTAFEKATRIVDNSINEKGWLVMDEIGPLELRKEGFYEIAKKALRNHPAPLLFVVREGLVNKMTEVFELAQPEIITKEKLEQL